MPDNLLSPIGATADYDVAIVGGGPAGLSAAIVLGRARRRVILCDHGKPRNYAARAVHGYLGLEGISPAELRQRGCDEARRVGVEIIDAEVTAACRTSSTESRYSRFELSVEGRPAVTARKLLLATGLSDVLPEIENIHEFYGKSVHHCPYCDGWEHRFERLAALGDGQAAVGLALSLRTWSSQVIACTNGGTVSSDDLERMSRNRIAHRPEPVAMLIGKEGVLETIQFERGPALPCDAMFFSADKKQRSHLPEMLGLDCDSDGCVRTEGKQDTGLPGLFLAGDADGDVQFAIVAAAEGATAATAINRELQDEEFGSG